MVEGRGSRDPGSGLTLAEVAEVVGGRVVGDAQIRVVALRPIDEAAAGDLGFLASRRYVRFAATHQAAALLVATELDDALPAHAPRVVVEHPHGALPALLDLLHPDPVSVEPGVHPTAVLGKNVCLGDRVSVGPFVVLGDRALVGDGTHIGAHSVIGAGVTVGADCHIHPHVVVYPGTRMGDRVVLHAGVRLGSDGFGYTFRDGAHRKIPQVGGCVIGDDVEIGANTTIDRGSIGDTVLGSGVKVDNLVQVAHNVRIGSHSLLAALVGVAGSTRIGSGVWLGGQAGLIGHLDIGDAARIAVATKVLRDVPAGETVSGHPARPHREELRRQAHLGRLPKLFERIEALEDEVGRLREALGDHAPGSVAGGDDGDAE